MAGKYALYLPYKVLDSLSSGNVTDSEFREFIMGLAEYDRSGIFPASRTAGFRMMYELLKPDLDFAKAKYEEIVEKRREAGKLGGAPLGNKNAKKNTSKPAKQAKQADNSIQMLEKRISSGSELTTTIFLYVKNKAAEHGFFLDDRETENLIQTINADWFEGHDFIDFIAETVRREYGNKPQRERHKIFRKLLFDARNLKEQYPQWHEAQIKADTENARREAMATKPRTCPVCGTAFMQGYLSCPAGHGYFEFDEATLEYRFRDSENHGNLAEDFRRHLAERRAVSR